MDTKGNGYLFVIVFLLLIILVLGIIGYSLAYALTTGKETITIKEKWRKSSGDDDKYLVSAEDGQVFQITDTFIRWRFNSSNLYADLDEGDVCSIKTQGWRFPLFSDYKNILEANCNESN